MTYSDTYPKARTAITAAFPGDDAFHRSVRLALLHVFHAASWVELDLQTIASWLQATLDDPPHSLEYGPTDDPLTLANNLEHLARQLRKASAALDAAKPQWIRFFDLLEGDHDAIPPTDLLGVRQPGPEPDNELIDGSPPF